MTEVKIPRLWHSGEELALDYTKRQTEWLLSTDSMTNRLRQLSNHTTHLELQTAGWHPIYAEERELLTETGVKHLLPEPLWVREVVHRHQSTPWIWARTVIPAETLHKTGLAGESTEPIGDILFRDPHLQRSKLEFTQVPKFHPYFRSIAQYLEKEGNSETVARRSILWFQQHPLLITEVFLPAFLREIL